MSRLQQRTCQSPQSRSDGCAGNYAKSVRGVWVATACIARPVIPKGPDPVPTTERDKELSGPNVGDRESDLLKRLAAGGIPQECANAVGCCTSCGLLASRTGAGEERFDFPELLAQPRLSGTLSGHGAWAPSYRRQWRQIVITIPARRMQQDRLQAGHTIPPSRSVRQASERPPCCQKESAVAYLLPILAEREPVERQRRQLYVSEISSLALLIEVQLIP